MTLPQILALAVAMVVGVSDGFMVDQRPNTAMLYGMMPSYMTPLHVDYSLGPQRQPNGAAQPQQQYQQGGHMMSPHPMSFFGGYQPNGFAYPAGVPSLYGLVAPSSNEVDNQREEDDDKDES